MKTNSKILLLAAVLLPGGALLLLIPLSKFLLRFARDKYEIARRRFA